MDVQHIKRGIVCTVRLALSMISLVALIVLSALYWADMPKDLVSAAFALFFTAMVARVVMGAYKVYQGSACSSIALRGRHT